MSEPSHPGISIVCPQCNEKIALDTPTTKQVAMLLSWAWTIIANAGGGDWTKESADWQEAAAKWRNEYHASLK